ncbi:hypothetical protein Tco_0903307 [Tanacetum coccineum]
MFNDFANMALPPRDQRNKWLRKIHLGQVLDFPRLSEINKGDGYLDMNKRLRMQHKGDDGEVLFMTFVWRKLLGIRGPLVGKEASSRRIATKSDLVNYWTRIASDGDFLGPHVSHTLIEEPLRRLCHRLIGFTIFGRGQSHEKVTTTNLFFLQSMDEGTMLGIHFGVITKQSLQTLTVEVQDLPTINPDELIKLRICKRVIDTVAWVAKGPPRQQFRTTGGDAQIDHEMPQAANAAPRTIAQRLHMVEDEVRRMSRHGMLDGMMSKHARYSTWMVDMMTELMESWDMMYSRFDGTIAPDTHLHFERRRVRLRTEGASTSAQQTQAQHDA